MLLNQTIIASLEKLKGMDITLMDVSKLSSFTDFFIIVTASSNRHLKAMADKVMEDTKAIELHPIGYEGMEALEWVLVDYGETVVHLMKENTRVLYDLESLWSFPNVSSRMK